MLKRGISVYSSAPNEIKYLLLLIDIFWFLRFFLGNPSKINGYEPMYTSARAHSNLRPWNTTLYRGLEASFRSDLGAQQYISRYEAVDIADTQLTESRKQLK